ncbi:unnamed protein product [Caenorhabditis auriculariae]|uniref:DUF19 domain-containing protein n=1 Tax=Caenorhabditis auriculariae TaxID=2777116 RepID=A0A8S1HPG8_9PELO|nr:unnamed protein product [Caenorhabditis auriculariae]
MKQLILLLVATGICLCDVTSNCDGNKFVICQKKFSDSLGIDQSYNWQNPLGLTTQIQNIYIKGGPNGQRGLNAVCNAYNSFIQCLSDSAFTAFECFDPRWLIKASSTPNQAYSYAFLMNMIQYQCGAGFYIASDNWSCMQRIYAGKNGTMTGCITNFVLNTQEDPNNACSYVQKGMDCFGDSARLQGCPDELRYYGCESFKQYTAPQFAYCTTQQCVVDTTFR